MNTIRAAAIVAGVAAVAGAAGGIDHVVARRSIDAPTAGEARPAGVASRPDALSSTWFCPGGPSAPGATQSGAIVLSNPTGTARAARVTVFPTTTGAGEVGSKTVTVVPHGTLMVRADDVSKGIGPGATEVLADGGGLVVTQMVRAADADVAGACAPAASDHWYVPVGSTAAGASTILDLFNPFATEAIVDLTFATTEGSKVPAELQGVVVPARAVYALDIGDSVRRQDAVASLVTVRDGRVIVGRTFKKGAAATVGIAAPQPAPAWFFPVAARTDAPSRLTIMNPGDLDADVTVEVRTDGDPIQPLTASVSAGGRTELLLDSPSLTKNTAVGLVVHAAEDVPIVVERSVEAKTTRSDNLGVRVGGRKLVANPVGRGTDALAIVNLGDGDAAVKVSVLDGKGVPVITTLKVTTGSRVTIKLDDRAKGLAVMIDSDQELAAERMGGEPSPTQGALAAVVIP